MSVIQGKNLNFPEDNETTFSLVTPPHSMEMLTEDEPFIDEEVQDFTEDDYEHNQNLAEILPETVLNKISADVLDAIEADDQSREEWSSSLADNFKLLGLKLEEEGLPFPGASGVYSTLIMQIISEFIATAIAHLLPPEGPAREEQIGESTEELLDKAQRVEDYFNKYLTQVDRGYYEDFEAMFFWICYAGNAIRKVFYDPLTNLPISRFIRPQDFIVNYGTSSLYDCFRMTERLKINAMELWKRQQNGMYRDISLNTFDDTGDSSSSVVVDDAVDRVLGQSKPDYDKKIEYQLYECHTYLNINDYLSNYSLQEKEEDINPKFLPYIITVDRESKKILGFYKGWLENDPEKKRNLVYSRFGYAQGPGFYKLGAAQLIGGSSKTCSELIRSTVNGLALSNMPGGLYAKGTRLDNNNLNISPGQFIPIETGGKSINDIFTTMPYKEPSVQIMALCNEMETKGARLMGTINSQIPDFNPNSPVGTTYALLDVINLVQSSVMRSLRGSMSNEFKIFFNFFKECLSEEPFYFNKTDPKGYISANDFVEEINIVPVADAHVTSKMQKQLQALSVLDRVVQFPQLHNAYEALEAYYKSIGISNINKILVKPEEVKPDNPLTENVNLLNGKAASAAIWQAHEAHIISHSPLLNNPNPQIVANTQAHIQHHEALAYLVKMQETMRIQLPQNMEQLSPEQQNQIALLAAQATQQLVAQQQQAAAPPPLDPAVVMLEEVKVKAEQVKEQAKIDVAKIELEMAKLELEKQKLEEKANADKEKISTDAFKAQLDYDAKLREIASRKGL